MIRERFDPWTALMPPAEARSSVLAGLSEKIGQMWDRVRDRPIGPITGSHDRRQWLQQFTFERPLPLEDFASGLVDVLSDGILLSQHPRCFGLFNPTPSFPGVVADLVTAAVNPQLAVTSHAPLATEIEAHLIKALATRIWSTGQLDGHFTSGGAEANMTAALLALTAALPEYAERGVRAFGGAPVLYASRESHFAWFKIAHQLGIGRDAVRLVATDGLGRMDITALQAAISRDKAAGDTPFLVVATAGTTNAGMIDPLEGCAEVAARHDCWFHVDAAWGGALLSSPDQHKALPGIEHAHSATVDAHKFFSVPMGAGMLLTRRGDMLGEAFRVSASYMPSNDPDADPYVRSAQWSRRFTGLKLFATLSVLGWPGVWQVVSRQIDLADLLATSLLKLGFRVHNASRMGVVCFSHDAVPAAELVRQVQDSQQAWISLAMFEESAVARACVTSFRATEEDVGALLAVLDLAVARSGAS
jgi:aromatic-L-amino-acid/L-tryptophan decarboxylase